MKIYKVERTDDWSYDDYNEFVCVANSPEEAKTLHPSNTDDTLFYHWKDGKWFIYYSNGPNSKGEEGFYSNGGWVDSLDKLKVTEIIPDFIDKPVVIVGSFNAG